MNLLFIQRGLLLFTLLAMGTIPLAAQQLMALPHKGEEVFVSQDLEASFLGHYHQKKGQLFLSRKDGESFCIKANGQKEEILWGLLTEGGQAVEMEVSEWQGGRSLHYRARILIVYYPEKNQGEELLLYQFEGRKFLGKAEKTESVAATER